MSAYAMCNVLERGYTSTTAHAIIRRGLCCAR
jgi:hypothetical protein